MFRSDDEFEDGTQILPFYWDSRKVVNVSRSRVGSGAPLGARPLPWLGCLACKHLTWIFRSLVSPASAPPAEWSPAAGGALSWAQSLFCPEPPVRCGPGTGCGPALLVPPRLALGFLQWKFHPKRRLSRELGAGPGPEPSESWGSGSGLELWSQSSLTRPPDITLWPTPVLRSSFCRPPLHTLGRDKSSNLTVTRQTCNHQAVKGEWEMDVRGIIMFDINTISNFYSKKKSNPTSLECTL